MMGETMRAAVLHGPGDLRVQDVPKSEITRPDQALVKIGAVGICGSDLHYYAAGRIGDYVVSAPMILGHEAAGQVVAVGAEVSYLLPGDHVAIEPGVPDQTCAFCRAGRYNLCPNVVFLATPPHDGAFAEYLVWPAQYLYPLPGSLSDAAGAMIEPLSVGLHAVWQSGLKAGETVAIFGAGPIGLMTLQCALAGGAGLAIILDTVPARLDYARDLGATHTLPAAGDSAEAIRALTGGMGVAVSFECAGAVPALHNAIHATRSGGTVQLVGLPAEQNPPLPVHQIIDRELRVQGLFRYANTYPAAIALAAAGRVQLTELVTHEFPLEETAVALPWVQEHREQVIKAIIRP